MTTRYRSIAYMLDEVEINKNITISDGSAQL
jgi:hypothetical protein